MSDALIIVNPMAGGTSDTVLSEVIDHCRRWVDQAVVRVTSGAEEAIRLAHDAARSVDPPAVVVAVGGDGTARDVAQGLADAAAEQGLAGGTDARLGGGLVPMFIVPAGTANSCYRTLWGDLAWPRALAAALADRGRSLRRLDLARLLELDRLVLAGACAGFPPQAIHEAGAMTGRSGVARYEAALLRLIPRYRPYPGRVVVDGVEVHCGPTLLANVGGSRYRGGQFEVLPHSLLDDGLLDVCVVGGEHPPAEILTLTRTATHLTLPGVVYMRGRRITIERSDGEPVWFEHDGEVLAGAGSSFTLEVVPAAVPVLVGAAMPLAASAAVPG